MTFAHSGLVPAHPRSDYAGMNTKTTVAALSCLAIVAAAGCGDGSDSHGCGGAACGGNLVGRWTITQSCSSQPVTVMADFCPEAKVTMAAGGQAGTAVFNRDMTFSFAVISTSRATWLVPPKCVQPSVGLTCDRFADLFSISLGAVTNSALCASTADGGCDCTFIFDGTVDFAGTYTTAGSTVTLKPTGAAGSAASSYCVSEPKLTISSMPMLGTTSVMVLTRQ